MRVWDKLVPMTNRVLRACQHFLVVSHTQFSMHIWTNVHHAYDIISTEHVMVHHKQFYANVLWVHSKDIEFECVIENWRQCAFLHC